MSERERVIQLLSQVDEEGERVWLNTWQIMERLGYAGNAHRQDFAKDKVAHVVALLDDMLKTGEIQSEFDRFYLP